MSKLVVVLGLVIGLAGASQVAAQEPSSNPTGLYLGGNIGLDYYAEDDDTEFDLGGSLGLLVGYRWSEHFRTDLEYGASIAEVDDDILDEDLAVVSLTINAYYDLMGNESFFAPYIGGGLGVAGVAIEDGVDADDLEAEFTIQGEAGVAMNISPNFAIVPSYRLAITDNSSDVTEEVLVGQSFKIGARLSF